MGGKRRNSVAIMESQVGLGAGPLNDTFGQARVHIQARNIAKLEEVFSSLPQEERNITDPQGNTLLHVACQNGYKRAVKLLLKWGCAMSIPNHHAQTPLHYCYGFKYTDLADYMLSKGADATVDNAYGLKPHECLKHGLKPKPEVAGSRNSRPVPGDAHELHRRAMDHMGGAPARRGQPTPRQPDSAMIALQAELQQKEHLIDQMKTDEKRALDAESQLQQKDQQIHMMKQQMAKFEVAPPKSQELPAPPKEEAANKAANASWGINPIKEDSEDDNASWGINPIIAMARQMVDE